MYIRFLAVVFLCSFSVSSFSQELRNKENFYLSDIPIWLNRDELIIDKYLVSISGELNTFETFNKYMGVSPIPSPDGEHLLWFDNKREITISPLDNSIINTITIPEIKENKKNRFFVAWQNNNQVYVMQFNLHNYSTACAYFDVLKGKWNKINNKPCPNSAFAHIFDLVGLASDKLLLFSAAEGRNALDLVTISANKMVIQIGKTLLLNSPVPMQSRLIANNPVNVLLMFPCELHFNNHSASCIKNSNLSLYNWLPETGELQLFKSGIDGNAVLSTDGKKYAKFENNVLCVHAITGANMKCISLSEAK